MGSNGDVCTYKRHSGGSIGSKYSDEFVSRRQTNLIKLFALNLFLSNFLLNFAEAQGV